MKLRSNCDSPSRVQFVPKRHDLNPGKNMITAIWLKICSESTQIYRLEIQKEPTALITSQPKNERDAEIESVIRMHKQERDKLFVELRKALDAAQKNNNQWNAYGKNITQRY